MVKTAEAYVVGGAVAGNDPVRAFHQIAFELGEFAADIAAAFLDHGDDLVSYLAALVAVVFHFKPFGEEGFQLV